MSNVNVNAGQLSASEIETLQRLRLRIESERFYLDLLDDYYKGEMVVRNLGIATPPQLEHLRVVVGWPAVVVDSIEERLDVEGFRYGNDGQADQDLWASWQANGLDFESGLVHLDALVFKRAFVTVGAPDKPGDPAVIVGEDPRHMAAERDPRTREVTCAFRMYSTDDSPFGPFRTGSRFGTLYLPNSTIHVQESNAGGWVVTDRDDHGLGQVCVIPFVNKSRSGDRMGHSEITPAVMSLTDVACRTAVAMEISREFYAAPQRYVLGAAEDAFVKPDGTTASQWEAVLGRIWAMAPNSDGTPMSAGTFPAADPKAFTDVLEMLGKMLASTTGLPSNYLGLDTVIPASADAIRMGTDRHLQRVYRKQRHFGHEWENVMRLAAQIQHGEALDNAQQLETVWRNPEIPTIVSTSQAILAQVEAGSVPATAGAVLDRLGYSQIEQAQMAHIRTQEQGNALIQSLAAQANGTQGAPGTVPNPKQQLTPAEQSEKQLSEANAAGLPHLVRHTSPTQLIKQNGGQ